MRPPVVVAAEARELVARVTRRVPMRYAEGADEASDRSAHVRAGSSVVQLGERLVVVQDDASFVALVDETSGLADAVPLPAGPGGERQFDEGRGNKAQKLDLEALALCEAPEGRLLLALGSGSSTRRESIALLGRLDSPAPRVRLVDASRLYAALRAAGDFAGSELNVEGAVVVGGRLRLFNRGNGAARDGRLPVNASVDLELPRLLAFLANAGEAPVPGLLDLVQFDLGTLRGSRLSFTDATLAPHEGAGAEAPVLYTASAEDSPDATRDGDVAGSVIGAIERGAGGVAAARWAELRDAHGDPLTEKVEGLALDPVDPRRLHVVVDVDDHTRPSELCEVMLDGPWPHLR